MICFTGLCKGNSPVSGEFPAERASNAENVSIWWRHHDAMLHDLYIWIWTPARLFKLRTDAWVCIIGSNIDHQNSIWCSPKTHSANVANDFDGVPLDKFRIVSQEEVRKITSSSPSKSCSLDPIPTSILKLCLDELTPVLTLFVNTFLEFADFTPELKRAFVLPLLKKAILDCEILKNFRPVSNLYFLSKLVERIVCVQLVDHLKAHHLYEVFQSAHRQLHSTETALLRVQNDLLRAVDTHGGAILVLLDLSATFDTINHQRLPHTLESSFGIKGKVLDWFQSYLTGRTQTVQIKKSTSEPHELKYGVPQGSVLGPILFTIYTTPLGQLIRRHGLTFHLYADDTQLYLAFKPSEPSSIVNNISRLEKCVDDIRAWMKLNLLKLNDDKTELLVITSRPSTSQSLHISIKVGDQDISPSEEPPKNLGFRIQEMFIQYNYISNLFTYRARRLSWLGQLSGIFKLMRLINVKFENGIMVYHGFRGKYSAQSQENGNNLDKTSLASSGDLH